MTELRAAVIIGSGSASFEIMRDLTRRLPAMVAPRWVSSRCEPIAIRDVVRYLVGCLGEPRTAGETFDIGGGTVLTYRDMLRVAAEEQHRPFRMLGVPVLTPKLSSYWLHLVTSVDMQVARPLIDGLRNDVVTHDHRIRELLPGPTLMPYREAVRARAQRRRRRAPVALAGRAASSAPRRRSGASGSRPAGRCSATGRCSRPPLAADELWRRVEANFGGRGGYGAKAEILWRLRGAADRVLGGAGLRRGRPAGALAEGDAVDWWRVERIEPGRVLSLVAEMRVPGVARLELEVEPTDARRPPRADRDAREHPPRVGPLLVRRRAVPRLGVPRARRAPDRRVPSRRLRQFRTVPRLACRAARALCQTRADCAPSRDPRVFRAS